MSQRRSRTLLFAALTAISALVAPAGAAQIDPVCASVNGRLVTERDLDFHVLEMRLANPALWSAPDGELYKKALPAAVDELLLYEQFWQASTEMPEADARSAADTALQEYRRLAGSEERLDQILKDMEVRIESLQGWLEARASRNWTIQGGIGQKVDPRLLNRTEDRPKDAVRMRLSQIFIAIPESGGPDAETEARGRAARIWLHLTEGMPFGRAAAIFSDDQRTAPLGGDLGWLEVEAIDARFLEVIRGLKVGQAAPPCEGPGGRYIFRLEDFETPARRELLEQIRDIRRNVLRRTRPEADIVLASGFELPDLREDDEEALPNVWDSILATTARKNEAANREGEGLDRRFKDEPRPGDKPEMGDPDY